MLRQHQDFRDLQRIGTAFRIDALRHGLASSQNRPELLSALRKNEVDRPAKFGLGDFERGLAGRDSKHDAFNLGCRPEAVRAERADRSHICKRSDEHGERTVLSCPRAREQSVSDLSLNRDELSET